ncbi:hypothetical protein EVAR_88151_1 [Eumeta japonica]|uniref:Uncharacterized protein n=1 Tax=Eumeta variegata TaxID=151549 RepID=A0A4C1WT15_EUMVA|nr:hypothetical protein EVAR_88151_1 [Eumeta japonica]
MALYTLVRDRGAGAAGASVARCPARGAAPARPALVNRPDRPRPSITGVRNEPLWQTAGRQRHFLCMDTFRKRPPIETRDSASESFGYGNGAKFCRSSSAMSVELICRSCSTFSKMASTLPVTGRSERATYVTFPTRRALAHDRRNGAGPAEWHPLTIAMSICPLTFQYASRRRSLNGDRSHDLSADRSRPGYLSWTRSPIDRAEHVLAARSYL